MGEPDYEIRRVYCRGERYYCYVAPGLTIRTQDHHYLLRVVSEKIAIADPERFSLLPENSGRKAGAPLAARLSFDLERLKRRARATRNRRPLVSNRMNFQLCF
jgi:hypothetical protein